MKYCTKCGASLEDSAQFCRSCGAPVEPVPAEEASTPSGKSTSSRPRRGIAAQFDTIAAGKSRKPAVLPISMAFSSCCITKVTPFFAVHTSPAASL